LAATAAVTSIAFTDITLVDAIVGDVYRDFVEAKAISGGNYSGVAITYVLTGTLPLGLTFNPSTGYITGTVAKDAIVGTYNVSIAATAPNYPTQNLAFTFRVAAAAVVAETPTVIPAAAHTIVFTDTTLVDGRVGRSYADYVKAKGFIGSVANTVKITYSLTGLLPAGLSFSKSTGYISGSVAKDATPGKYKVLVSAAAAGYTTSEQAYEFTINPATTVTVNKPVTPTPSASPSTTPNTQLKLMGTVWFDSGKSVLSTPGKKSLDLMVNALKTMKFTKITVNGYTDAVNGKSHSVLSLARANSVKKYLQSKNKALVITTKGLGIATTSKSSSASIQASRMAQVWVG
jgi:outer membrane protein OmpA-like peptidoglycan-associated protein